jgi:hypothetical protein
LIKKIIDGTTRYEESVTGSSKMPCYVGFWPMTIAKSASLVTLSPLQLDRNESMRRFNTLQAAFSQWRDLTASKTKIAAR